MSGEGTVPLVGLTVSQLALVKVVNVGEPLEVLMVTVCVCAGPPTCDVKLSEFLSTLRVCAGSAAAAHKKTINGKLN